MGASSWRTVSITAPCCSSLNSGKIGRLSTWLCADTSAPSADALRGGGLAWLDDELDSDDDYARAAGFDDDDGYDDDIADHADTEAFY